MVGAQFLIVRIQIEAKEGKTVKITLQLQRLHDFPLILGELCHLFLAFNEWIY